MCLMLYCASEVPIPLRALPEMNVEEVEPERAAVRQWLSLPEARYIGAHTGCSCGFPSVVADEPVAYFDGMFDDAEEDRAKNLASVRALFALLDELLAKSDVVELLPVWAGDEYGPPAGVMEVKRAQLVAEEFFFMESFLYRVRG